MEEHDEILLIPENEINVRENNTNSSYSSVNTVSEDSINIEPNNQFFNNNASPILICVWGNFQVCLTVYYAIITIIFNVFYFMAYSTLDCTYFKYWGFVESVLLFLMLTFLIFHLLASCCILHKPKFAGMLYTYTKLLGCGLLVSDIIGLGFIIDISTSNSDCLSSTNANNFWLASLIIVVFELFFVVCGCISCVTLTCLVCCFFLQALAHYSDENISVSGAPKSIINALPLKLFKEGSIEKEDAMCSICFDDYEKDDKIRYLPCDHHFHSKCVDQWLEKNKTCPLCRKPIDQEEEEDNGAAEEQV
eukprot:TRINITY_DN82_c0_g1_i1.p1 TRINITY_DN82_c0_g1~~TRINITY_DN82_c0_g1_i1.p1  ORF type:complete len:306 (+),score=71.05 TRINITY_DN82_c0_g1_i1:509-1426(+)